MSQELVRIAAAYAGVAMITLLAGILPALRIQPYQFEKPRRDGLIALGLFIPVLLLSALFYANAGNVPGGVATQGVPAALWQRMAVSVFAMAAIGVLLIFTRQPAASFGWGVNNLTPAFRLSLALVVWILLVNGKLPRLVSGISEIEGTLALVWLGIALAEETLFRGFFQQRLVGWLGGWIGVLLSAVLYILWELPAIMADPGSFPTQLGLAAVKAITLGWVTHHGKNVLTPVLTRTVMEWTAYI